MKNGILGIVLAAHMLWVRDDETGFRANLSYANLSYANLSGANLRDANLSYANLRDANLSGANLSGANLSGANLRDANLSDADLSYADLSDADLSYADLSDAYGNGSPDMTCIQIRWMVVITRESMAIGCQQHPVTNWWEFDDEAISDMNPDALSWWRIHKPILQALWQAKFGDLEVQL